jgi:hypothetical protein
MKTAFLTAAFVVAISGCATDPADETGPLPGEKLAYARAVGGYGEGAAKAGVKAMKRAEVRACADSLTRSADLASTLTRQSDSLQANRMSLVGQENQIERDRLHLNLASEQEVNAHNARVRAIQGSIRSHNLMVDEHNALLKEAETLTRSFNLNCVNRPYRVADLHALPEKERMAMERGSTSFDLPVYSDKPRPRIGETHTREGE